MNTISFFRKSKASNNTKFDQLTYSSNGLLIQYLDNPGIEIPFADINKIYIKKHKINPVVEFIGISVPFLSVYLVTQYLPSMLLIVLSIIAILPIFVRLINYKWYRLYIRLHDGSSYRKKITKDVKTESFSVLEKVRAEYINYNTTAIKLV